MFFLCILTTQAVQPSQGFFFATPEFSVDMHTVADVFFTEIHFSQNNNSLKL